MSAKIADSGIVGILEISERSLEDLLYLWKNFSKICTISEGSFTQKSLNHLLFGESSERDHAE